jgi:hypothetical protein
LAKYKIKFSQSSGVSYGFEARLYLFVFASVLFGKQGFPLIDQRAVACKVRAEFVNTACTITGLSRINQAMLVQKQH